MYWRNITQNLLDALSDSPVVLLNGARQTGKSTLVQELAAREHPARYLTFDDLGVLVAAKEDPVGFLAGLDGPVILDEVQRVPELFLPLKAEVDRNREPGRFLLTGSANIMLLPRLAEALVGRMEILTLEPFSQGELAGHREGFIDAIFSDGPLSLSGPTGNRKELVFRLLRGGYPEAVRRESVVRRQAWYDSYIATLLQRDLTELSRIEGFSNLPRLLNLLAARVGGLLNLADISRTSSIPHSTLRRYMALLQATFLVRPLPAWSANLGKRQIKTPKLYLNDTGLLAHLLGVDIDRLNLDNGIIGPLLENFVIGELRKQKGWSKHRPIMYHHRTQSGEEVDIILEDRAGRIVGIEIKAASSLGSRDLRWLRSLADSVGSRFHRGVILYNGNQIVPFGPNLQALPLDILWQG